jgi:DNA-binding GntR family transcriptional regulator
MQPVQPISQNQTPPKSTEDLIYTALYNAICERQLPPQTKLGEKTLADHYGVSRTIIRQVLLRLSIDHLVKLEPNRGAFVTHLSLEEARQIYEAWRLIEAAIIRDITPAIMPQQVASLRSLIAEERQACEQGDIPQLTRLSTQFHIQLAELCSNLYLSRFLKELIPQTALAYFYEIRNMPICGEDEHSKILDAIATGDTEIAVELAMRHLDGIESALNARAALKQPASLVEILQPKILSLSGKNYDTSNP